MIRFAAAGRWRDDVGVGGLETRRWSNTKCAFAHYADLSRLAAGLVVRLLLRR